MPYVIHVSDCNDGEKENMIIATARIWAIATALLLSSTICTAQQPSKKLTNHDITEMVSLGLSDDLVVDKIHAADATDFDTTIDGLKFLKAANVSDIVIRAMINPRPPILVPASDTTTVPKPVPTPRTDPNDPNSPHDPGIYMYAKSRDGLSLTMLEPTVYSQGKTTGTLKMAMTYGVAKMKWKAVVQGAHANLKSSDNSMVFYFYFEESNAGLSHASFGGTTSPNEFTLLKFDEKKDSRETVVMSMNALGGQSGTDEKASIRFTSTKLRPGVYQVTPSAPLQAGEYCFLSSLGVGAFGAGSAGASRLFDFTVAPGQ